MNGQLNGWFGRFIKKAISKIAGFVDSALNTATYGISSEIGSFQTWSNEIGVGGSDFWNRTTYNDVDLSGLENDPRGNYEPTSFEEEILNAFLDDFSKVVANISEMTIGISKLSNSEKITTSNKIVERTAIVKAFYATNQNKGLSPQALDLRNLIVEVMLLKIEKLVNDEVANTGAMKTTRTISLPVSKEFLYALQPIQKNVIFPFSVNYNYYLKKESVIEPINTVTKPNEPSPTTPETTGNKKGLKIFGLFVAVVTTARLLSK